MILRETIQALSDHSAEDIDRNDHYSDWTGPLEPTRQGPEKRYLAAQCLATSDLDNAEIEAELEQPGNEEATLYYFGFDSPAAARLFRRDPLAMLEAIPRVGVPFRGPALIPAAVIAPGLASADPQVVEAVLVLMSKDHSVNFWEPAPAAPTPAAPDWRVQAYSALAQHRWDLLTELLDAAPSDEVAKPLVKAVPPTHLQHLAGSKRLNRLSMEAELAALRRDISKAAQLAPRLKQDPETAPVIVDALFHRRFELASPPPYHANNRRNAEAVLQLFRANPEAFARAIDTQDPRRRILIDLFVKGFGDSQHAQEFEAALNRIKQ